MSTLTETPPITSPPLLSSLARTRCNRLAGASPLLASISSRITSTSGSGSPSPNECLDQPGKITGLHAVICGQRGVRAGYWAEVLYHLRKNNPFLDDEQVGGVRRRLAAVFATGLITGYQIDSSTGYPDVYDAHVHCAAVHGRADIIVTGNARDFTGMDEQPYEVYSPDDFFVLVDDSAPETVLSALRTQLRYYREKGGRFSLPEQLRTAGAPRFTERVRQYMHRIDINTI